VLQQTASLATASRSIYYLVHPKQQHLYAQRRIDTIASLLSSTIEVLPLLIQRTQLLFIRLSLGTIYSTFQREVSTSSTREASARQNFSCTVARSDLALESGFRLRGDPRKWTLSVISTLVPIFILSKARETSLSKFQEVSNISRNCQTKSGIVRHVLAGRVSVPENLIFGDPRKWTLSVISTLVPTFA
jgi:hypothetical protein